MKETAARHAILLLTSARAATRRAPEASREFREAFLFSPTE
jgi:hypothetical protein